MTATCPTDQELAAVLDGELPASTAESLDGHLSACGTCRAKLDALSNSSGLSDWVGDGPLPPNPFPFLSRSDNPRELGTVGRYRVEAEIGRGGMGVVFRAWDDELKRYVALEVLRVGRDDEQSAERFAREARAAGNARHDHLVPNLDVIRTADGRPVIVMPLVAGPTLRARIKSAEPPSPPEAARIIRQIADGLSALHAGGWVHRDVKPANILLDRADGRAKLTDFGLSRDPAAGGDALTQEDVIVGTPEYLAPEQAADGRAADARADLYSLGVTLYECLTGVVPFRGPPLDVLRRHRDEEPVPIRSLNSAVPADLETVCGKCLAKAPERRYASAADLRDDLDRLLANRPILARPSSRRERSLRWCRRNPWPVAVVAVSLLGGVVAAGGWWTAGVQAAKARASGESATEQARRADENARLADDRAALSLDAINTLVTKAQNLAGNTPGTLTLKKQLGEAALVDLRKLTDAVRQVPGAERSTRQAHMKLAATFQLLGQTDESLAEWELAGALAEARLADQPGEEESRRDLASIHSNLGSLFTRQAKYAEAARYGDSSIRALEALRVAHPDDPKTSANLALAYTGRADTHLPQGESRAALDAYTRAADLLTEAIRLRPDDAGPPATLFTVTAKVGYVHLARHDYVAAEAGFRKQLELARGILARTPNDPVWQRNLRLISLDLSSALQRQGRGAESEAVARTVLVSLAQAAAADPDNAVAQRDHSVGYEHLGNAELVAGKFADAEASYLKAVAIVEAIVAKSPRGSQFAPDLFSLSYALACATQLQGRYEAAAGWIGRHGDTAVTLYGKNATPAQQALMTARFAQLGEALRRTPAAIADAESIDPLPPEVTKTVRLFRITHLSLHGGQGQARSELDAVLEASPGDPQWLLLDAKLHGQAARTEVDPARRERHVEAGTRALLDALKAARGQLDTLYLSPELVPVRGSPAYRKRLDAMLNGE